MVVVVIEGVAGLCAEFLFLRGKANRLLPSSPAWSVVCVLSLLMGKPRGSATTMATTIKPEIKQINKVSNDKF